MTTSIGLHAASSSETCASLRSRSAFRSDKRPPPPLRPPPRRPQGQKPGSRQCAKMTPEAASRASPDLFTGNHHASASVTCLEFTRKGVCVKRGAVLLAVAASLIAAPDPAAAKGSIQARGYAVITGPDLSHPIVYSAPWGSSKGGYYSDDAEIFLNLATYSGAIAAGRDLISGSGSVPDGVLPLRSVPMRDALGPGYRLTWFRDDVSDVASQDIYPYARGGPIVYTFPSSRQALITLFGRFQDPDHVWTGWGRDTPQSTLLGILQGKGLPRRVPSVGVGAPAHRSWSGLALSLSALGILAVLVTSGLWFRRHRRKADAAGMST